MTYTLTDLSVSAKEIVQQVLEAQESQLLIPPGIADQKPEIPIPPRDGIYIGLFSSGSTGTPKCIWNKKDNLLKNARFTARAFGVESSHRLLMMAAPWHVAGLSWALMAEQLHNNYSFVSTKKGEADRWLNAILHDQPDFLMTVPAVLRALYGNEWFVPNVVYGGYPIRNEEYELLATHCTTMIQGYGQTEAGGLISSYNRASNQIPASDEHLCHGSVIDGGTLVCEGTKTNPKPILLQSSTAFVNHLYDTGDIGYKDEGGNIYIVLDK